MKVVQNSAEIAKLSAEAKESGKSVGFVPTMGALHPGHISLVERARKENDVVICSIFVNPTQFNNSDDLEKYPRTFEKDSALLESALCDYVFYPDVEEMYPEGFKGGPQVNLDGLDEVMEGSFRPGHFDGVITIVNKFFEIVSPNKAYFGLKDYQQYLVIDRLAQQYHSDLEVIPCEIVREEGGLAMSSRNARLSSNHSKASRYLFSQLIKAREYLKRHGVKETERRIRENFKKRPEFNLEYFKIADSQSLRAPRNNRKNNLRAFVAAHIGGVRLIDNIEL
ncbi:pantoate--beta-alanine ligase [bacterium SCSIO 12741]|nr:pantoate--beta-alanine ligase [bacterium SCSIO 12741]